jgi:hypothetical protein
MSKQPSPYREPAKVWKPDINRIVGYTLSYPTLLDKIKQTPKKKDY